VLVVFKMRILPPFLSFPSRCSCVKLLDTSFAISRSAALSKMPSKAGEDNQHPILRFAKLSANAYTPTRGSALAAGYDLYRYETMNWLEKAHYSACYGLLIW
jgi:hypothetical protein